MTIATQVYTVSYSGSGSGGTFSGTVTKCGISLLNTTGGWDGTWHVGNAGIGVRSPMAALFIVSPIATTMVVTAGSGSDVTVSLNANEPFVYYHHINGNLAHAFNDQAGGRLNFDVLGMTFDPDAAVMILGMVIPPCPHSDAFTGTNGDTCVGRNLTVTVGSSADLTWEGSGNAFKIASNKAGVPNSATRTAGTYDSLFAPETHPEIEASVKVNVPSGSNSFRGGLIARQTGADVTERWEVAIELDSGIDETIRVKLYDNSDGGLTEYGSADLSGVASTQVTLLVNCYGDTITVKINGVTKITYAAATQHNAGTVFGIFTRYVTNTDDDILFDDYLTNSTFS